MPRFDRGQPELGGEHVGAGVCAEKRLAHPLDDMSDGREVDRNLIRKTLPCAHGTGGMPGGA